MDLTNNFLGLPSTEELYNYAFESNFVGLLVIILFRKKHLT